TAVRGTGNNSLIVGNEAVLNTNIDPANTQSGLKRNHQFVVEGVFDLVDPAVVRQQYGIELTDGFGQLADDLVSLLVRSEAGGLTVRMTDNNSVLDITGTVISQPLFSGSADQIRLRLSHGAGDGFVSGSYELLDHGAVVGGGFLGQLGIFGTDTPFPGDDNNWIRAGLIANALDTSEFVQVLDGNYGTLSVSNAFLHNVGDLVYTPGAGTQALAQGESVIDTFFVRTVDQYGMSSAQRVEVTVNGVNDAPTAVGDQVTTTEDLAISVAALANDFDVDDGDTFSLLSFATTSFYGASIGLNPDGTFSYDPTNADALQSLNDGESRFDTFSYTIVDNHGETGAGTVTVEVHGVTDGNNVPPLAVPDTNGADAVIESPSATFSIDRFASGNVLFNDFDPDPNPGL